MCGSRFGIISCCSFLSLFLLCLAPEAFAASTTTATPQASGRTLDFTLGENGLWEMSNTPATSSYYVPSGTTPTVNAAGDAVNSFDAPSLPIADSPLITDSTLVKVGDVASVAAPYLAQLASLDPLARAAIGGASVLFGLWQAYYSAKYPPDGSPSKVAYSKYYCGSSLVYSSSTPTIIISNGTYHCMSPSSQNPCGSPSGFCYAIFNSVGGGICPYVNLTPCPDGSLPSPSPSSASTSSPTGNAAKIPAPSLAQVQSMLNANKNDILTFLKNLPKSELAKIPMTQSLSGPASTTGQSTTSTSSGPTGNVTKVVTPVTYYTYNGNTVKVQTINLTKTTTCTTTGTCTTTKSHNPVNMSPFIPPASNYPKISTVVPTNSTPFTAFSFGSPWLPKTCPHAPTFQVCVVGGSYCKTEKLPTNIICKLASGIEPVVTAGGGLLGILILAW